MVHPQRGLTVHTIKIPDTDYVFFLMIDIEDVFIRKLDSFNAFREKVRCQNKFRKLILFDK